MSWLPSSLFVLLQLSVTLLVSVIFFFKQRTSYEMRISDWSSDVCSSDLEFLRLLDTAVSEAVEKGQLRRPTPEEPLRVADLGEIGRASVGKECVSPCRSRWSPDH